MSNLTVCDPCTPWHPDLLPGLACATGGVYIGEAKHEGVGDVMEDIYWVL